MKRYEAYRPTKYEWLTEVPTHWQTRTMRSLTTVSSERRGNREATLLSVYREYGVIVKSSRDDNHNVESEDLSNYKWVRTGDLVMNKMKMWQGSLGVSEFDGIVSPAYIVCHINDENVNRRYLHMLLRSPCYKTYYNQFSYGIRVGQWDMHYEDFKGLEVALPPRAEQDQIVRYLDWQVSKINRLIAAKRKQIALLHEQHKRRISEAVLHGNDDGCCQKDSGVEWIGMIPEHWSVIRCKYVFTERDERSIAGEEEHLSMSQKYGLVPDSKLDEQRMLSETYVGGKICYKNDLVLNRLKAHLGVFALSPQKGVISPDYTVLVPNAERILPTYGEAVLKSDLCRRELRIRVRGIIEGFWRLYTDDFNTIVIPLPTLKEQRQIMEYIGALDEKSIVLKQNLEKEIVVLQDLRTRLISDVVTGQIDVRGIEVPKHESVDDVVAESEAEELEVE